MIRKEIKNIVDYANKFNRSDRYECRKVDSNNPLQANYKDLCLEIKVTDKMEISYVGLWIQKGCKIERDLQVYYITLSSEEKEALADVFILNEYRAKKKAEEECEEKFQNELLQLINFED